VGPNILDPMAGIKSQDTYVCIVLVSSALVKPQMNKGVGHFFMKLRQTTLKLGFLRYPSFEFLCTLASWHGMAYWDYDLLQLLYTCKKSFTHTYNHISSLCRYFLILMKKKCVCAYHDIYAFEKSCTNMNYLI